MNGKVVIVTGSSRGLGKAIALGLGAMGMHVVVAARSDITENPDLPGTISQTVSEIKEAGGDAFAAKCDATEEKSVQAMVERTIEKYDRIDVLENNADVAFYY